MTPSDETLDDPHRADDAAATDDLQAALAADLEAAPPPQSGDALMRLKAMADRVLLIDSQIEVLEDRLKVRKVARYEILTREMVELMDDPAVAMESLEVDGRRFEVADFYHAAIKADADDRDEAFDYLERQGAGDLIKYTVLVTFGRDSEEEAAALERYVRERHQAAEVERKREVPWKRLTAWVKERCQTRAAEMADGRAAPPDLPYSLLGARVGRVVELKKSKKGRAA